MLLPSYLLWLRSALPELTTNQYIESTKYLPIFLTVICCNIHYPKEKRYILMLKNTYYSLFQIKQVNSTLSSSQSREKEKLFYQSSLFLPATRQQQLATLYNDINGCFSLPGLENYLLITTNWAAVEVLKMSYLQCFCMCSELIIHYICSLKKLKSQKILFIKKEDIHYSVLCCKIIINLPTIIRPTKKSFGRLGNYLVESSFSISHKLLVKL